MFATEFGANQTTASKISDMQTPAYKRLSRFSVPNSPKTCLISKQITNFNATIINGLSWEHKAPARRRNPTARTWRQVTDDAMSQRFESTATLLRKINNGDQTARERLCALYLPLLTRWAHGRLPAYARDLSETADMVQLTLFKALDKIPDFDNRGEGAFLAYLRQILLNSIRKEVQKQQRRQQLAPMDHDQILKDHGPSVLEQAMGAEVMDAYEAALKKLPDKNQQAVILRLELDFSFPEIADAMDLNSANAARMLVVRSFEQLARHMPDV